MARPIEYDKQEVLDRITNAFWLKGYEGTSVSELVSETQLNTRTMYNLFEDKTGLFHAALENYYQSRLQSILDRLSACHTLENLVEFIESYADSEYLNGCLFVNTLSEHNTISKKSLKYVHGYFQQFKEILSSKLSAAGEGREFTQDADIVANMIICFIQGYCTYIKLGKGKEANKLLLDHFASLLKVSHALETEVNADIRT